MTFLNPWCLFGTVAVLVPLAIHLMQRRRVRAIPWAANHLLQSASVRRRTRPRWEEFLLLVLRLMLPVLLALALAGPLLDRFSGAKDVREVVVVVDNSLSMQANRGRGWKQVQQEAKRLAAEFPEAEFHLSTTTTGVVADGLTADAFQALLESTRTNDLLARPRATIFAAAASASSGRKCVVAVISAFRGAVWDEFAESSTGNAANQLGLHADQTLALLRVPSQASPTEEASRGGNVQVRFSDSTPTSIRPGQPHILSATVQNYSDRQFDAQVELRLDSKTNQRKSVRVPPGGVSDVTFGLEVGPTNAGKQTVAAVHLATQAGEPWGDALPKDDQDQLVLRVDPPGDVVVVADELAIETNSGMSRRSPFAAGTEAHYFAAAFDPYHGLSDSRSKYRVTAAASNTEALAIAPGLGNSTSRHLLVFYDANAIPQETGLRKFVEDGGVLWAIPKSNEGSAVTSDSSEAASLLPLHHRGVQDAANQVRLETAGWLSEDSRLGQSIQGGLRQVEVKQYVRMQEPVDGLRDVVDLVTASDGNLIVVAKRIGNGFVLQFAIGLSPEWSNLGVQPIALPLVQHLAHTVQERTVPRSNVVLGTVASELADSLEPVGNGDHDASQHVGLYQRFSLSDGKETAEGELPAVRLTAVRLAEGTGDLVGLDDERITSLASSLTGEGTSSVVGSGTSGLFGLPVWTPIMLAVAAILLLEGFLANRRSAGEATANSVSRVGGVS